MPTLPYTEHFINSLPGIFYLFDTSGKFLLWNKNFETASGYSAEEINEMHPLDFFEGEEKLYIAERIKIVFEQGKSDAEAYFVNKNGTKTPYYFTGNLFLFEGKPCLIGMGINISEQKKAQEKLMESEERYRQIVETSQEGIWLFDEHNNTTFVNSQLAKMLGYEREEMIGLSFYHFMDEKGKKIAEEKIERRKSGIAEQYEFLYLKKNGEYIWTLSNTNPIFRNGIYKGSLLMVTDITAQKETERRLQLSEQKFKSLVQNSTDIITVIDALGNYQFVSPSVKRLLGYDIGFLLGKNAFDFIHPEDKEMVAACIADKVNYGKDEEIVYRFLHQNGTWRWVESRGSNLLEDPVIKGLVVNTRDISERKQLQDELNKKNKEKQKEITAAVIQTQERERSQLGQELHDNVNQVLTTVKLYVEMLRDGLGRPDELITKSLHLLQNSIDEIRSVSKRLSAPTLGSISLSDSIKELVESINVTKRVKITYSFSDMAQEYINQEVHLAVYRIVQEQINNIIKYAGAKQVFININISEQVLHLTIKDDGKGFDLNSRRSGIGIINMKTRAENLNGTFSIETEPGKGCLVTVELPL